MSKSKAKGKPVDKVERVLFTHISNMGGRDVARHYKCGYSGDMDPVRHGGFFYDARDWEAYGYASAVEFWEHPETGHLFVSCGTINRPDDMERAWRCVGINEDDRDNIDVQIYAARAYCGIEPDDYTQGKSFDLDTWDEWRIWRSVHGWLKALGE